MPQVQCPNCGGFRINGERISRKPGSDKLFHEALQYIPLLIWGLSRMDNPYWRISHSILNWMEWGSLYFSSDIHNFYYDYEQMLQTFAWIIGLGFYSGIGYWFYHHWVRYLASYGYDYKCIICGYKWRWKGGDPMPLITVRPDLIHMDEKKLQEEEESETAKALTPNIRYKSFTTNHSLIGDNHYAMGIPACIYQKKLRRLL